MSWINQTKASTTFTNNPRNLERTNLLIESPYRLLIGDGSFLDIEPNIGSTFTNQSKSSTTFTNQNKT